MEKFKVSINGENTFELTKAQALELDAIKLGDNQYHLLKDNRSHHIEILASDFLNRTYTVKVNNSEYEVDISTALEDLIKELGFELGASKQVSDIKAPMPGLILSLNVKEGQEVEEGDSLLILEAMKMENNFNSPRSGVIKSITVKEGQAVDKGQVLIEFE